MSDTGIGIPEHKRDVIFDSFSQVESSSTRSYGGTGLGLSISKGLVELLEGAIGVTSELEKGSTFWVDLPLEASNLMIDESKDLYENIACLALNLSLEDRHYLSKLFNHYDQKITFFDGDEFLEYPNQNLKPCDNMLFIYSDFMGQSLSIDLVNKIKWLRESHHLLSVCICTDLDLKESKARLKVFDTFLLRPLYHMDLEKLLMEHFGQSNQGYGLQFEKEVIPYPSIHVLLVDDDEMHQTILVSMLKKSAFK